MPLTLASAVEELVREEYGSNKALVEHIRVSESTIQRIRHGHIPSLATLKRLAEGIPQYSLLELQKMAGILEPSANSDRSRRLRAAVCVSHWCGDGIVCGRGWLVLRIAVQYLHTAIHVEGAYDQ